MSSPYFEPRDLQRAKVRIACAAIDGDLLHLVAPEDNLRAHWAELLDLLVESHALEPARELRVCPVCNATGMRDATRCLHCWTKLPKLAH